EREDLAGEPFAVRLVGKGEPRPGMVEHMQAVAERRARPTLALASQLLPEEGARSLVLDDPDPHLVGDGDAAPVVPGGEMEGEVDAQRRLAGAAVAVDHHVAAFG